MFIKYYEKFKKFIINNYLILTFYLVFIVTLTYQLPYYIFVGGGVIDTNNRVEIENEYKVSGTFNLSYVTQLNATIPTIIISKFRDDWDVASISDYQLDDSETMEDIELRDKLYLEEANNNAIYNAYKLANVNITKKNIKNTVIYIDDNSKTNIKLGDQIIKINNIDVTDIYSIREIVNNSKYNDILDIDVIRDGKRKKCTAKIFEEENNKLIGISVITTYDYDTDKDIKLKFNNNESGPSGGLMTALTIYNKLTKDDITHGLNIAGTGTIESDGSVGEIGGIKYKLAGAVKANMDVFIAPTGDNFEEVKRIKKNNNLDIILIEAKTLEQVVDELNKL